MILSRIQLRYQFTVVPLTFGFVVAALTMAPAHGGTSATEDELGGGQQPESRHEGGEPDLATPNQGTTSREEIEQRDVPENEIRDYAEHHNLSTDDAHLRINLEEATTGLDTRLQRHWPDTYAGSWMDPGDLEVTLSFAGDVDPQHVRDRVEQEFAFPDHVIVRDGADYSLAEVEQIYEQVAEDFRHLHETGNHAKEELENAGGDFGIGLDIRNNGLTLTIPESTREHMSDSSDPSGTREIAEAVEEYYDFDNVAVDEVDDIEGECSRTNCQWDMMAGHTVDMEQ